MKNIVKNTTTKITAIVLLWAALAGCDMLDNPLKDKETGEDINVLVLDFNFFSTRMTFKLIDADDNSTISVPATLTFTGSNANDIVDFAGEKHTDFTTTQGQMELTIDPNVTISESSPFEFAVNVEAEGYNTLAQGVQFQSEGIKTIELYLVKTASEEENNLSGNINISNGDTAIVFGAFAASSLKSSLADEKPYTIAYSISVSDFLKFKDASGNRLFSSSADVVAAYNASPSNFLKLSLNTYSNYPSGIDLVKENGIKTSRLFHKLETTRLNYIQVGGKKIANFNGGKISLTANYTGNREPEVFGFARFETDSWNILGATAAYENPSFNYTLVEASGDDLCSKGASITFSSNSISSFSIDADVYDMDDNFIYSLHFKGNFPETFVVENTPNKAVKLVFRDNNSSFETIPDLTIDNFCTGSYDVDITAKSNYKEYQISLKAICPEKQTVAMAPTYTGEIKMEGDNQWQGINMKGGIVNILAAEGQEYQLRLLWEDTWEQSTFYTEFDAAGNYLHSSSDKTFIKSEKMEDGRIRINVTQEFKQSVCDDLGW